MLVKHGSACSSFSNSVINIVNVTTGLLFLGYAFLKRTCTSVSRHCDAHVKDRSKLFTEAV